MCVFAHSRFIENPPIGSWETNPSFLRWFCHNDVALVDRLRYYLLSVSQLVDADLSVLFHKSDSHVCGISPIGNVFQPNFSFAQSSLMCLISQSSSEL
jgi:hypothetical protein